MTSNALTVAEYLQELPEDRRVAIQTVRDVILANLPKGYEEVMLYGMISYVVPHSIYPAGYHCDPKKPVTFGSLASQKNHMAIYSMATYMNPELRAWVREEFKKAGKTPYSGSCIKFKKLEDLPLEVIGRLFARVPVESFIKKLHFGS